MTLGDNIRARRKELGLTQKELGARVGVAEATIARYESNVITTPSYEVLQKLVSVLGVEPNFLLGYDGHVSTDKQPSAALDTISARLSKAFTALSDIGRERVADYAEDLHKSGNYAREDSGLPFAEEAAQYVAVIGSAAAGAGFAYADDVERLVTAVSAPPHDFAIDVKGDSMFPTIFDGDVAFVVKASDKIDRQIYVLDIDGETVIKRCIFEPDALELISDNPDWSTRRITGRELESTRILGRVVGWQSAV